MRGTEKQRRGSWGERRAVAFLKNRGYKIVKKNFRIREGEIDIIAWHEKFHFGETLVFVEVKTRSSFDGSAERSVGKSKLERIFKVARVYCILNHINIHCTPIQFEQVSVYQFNGKEDIRHYVIPVE